MMIFAALLCELPFCLEASSNYWQALFGSATIYGEIYLDPLQSQLVLIVSHMNTVSGPSLAVTGYQQRMFPCRVSCLLSGSGAGVRMREAAAAAHCGYGGEHSRCTGPQPAVWPTPTQARPGRNFMQKSKTTWTNLYGKLIWSH